MESEDENLNVFVKQGDLVEQSVIDKEEWNMQEEKAQEVEEQEKDQYFDDNEKYLYQEEVIEDNHDNNLNMLEEQGDTVEDNNIEEAEQNM